MECISASSIIVPSLIKYVYNSNNLYIIFLAKTTLALTNMSNKNAFVNMVLLCFVNSPFFPENLPVSGFERICHRSKYIDEVLYNVLVQSNVSCCTAGRYIIYVNTRNKIRSVTKLELSTHARLISVTKEHVC